MSAPQGEPAPASTIKRWFFRIKGSFIIISSLAVGGLGWMVLALLDYNIHKSPDIFKDLPALVTTLVRFRAAMPLLILPALLTGVALLPRNRRASTGWMQIIAAALWLVAVFALIVYCFVLFLTPLYTYQPL